MPRKMGHCKKTGAGRDRNLKEQTKLRWYVYTDPVTEAMEKRQAIDNEPGPTVTAC